jgi:hypothetical protein
MDVHACLWDGQSMTCCLRDTRLFLRTAALSDPVLLKLRSFKIKSWCIVSTRRLYLLFSDCVRCNSAAVTSNENKLSCTQNEASIKWWLPEELLAFEHTRVSLRWIHTSFWAWNVEVNNLGLFNLSYFWSVNTLLCKYDGINPLIVCYVCSLCNQKPVQLISCSEPSGSLKGR